MAVFMFFVGGFLSFAAASMLSVDSYNKGYNDAVNHKLRKK